MSRSKKKEKFANRNRIFSSKVGNIFGIHGLKNLIIFVFLPEAFQRGSKVLPEINAPQVMGIGPELIYFSISQYKR